jgi:DNA sulfur modification protein DndE
LEATKKLGTLKLRTGLTPNILGRIALCYSLKEPGSPKIKKDSQGQEFNRFTLLGEWDSFYIALLKMRLLSEEKDPNGNLLPELKDHIERGVDLLFQRVKNFTDLSKIS